MIELGYEALVAETMPLPGAVAPEQVTGVAQVGPEKPEPAAHVHENELEASAHVPPFEHGIGVHGDEGTSQVGSVPDQVPSTRQVRVLDPPLPTSTYPLPQAYETTPSGDADVAETEPCAGFARPLQTTGASQFLPVHPGSQAPHEYVFPTGVQAVPCTQRDGAQGFEQVWPSPL